jgi:hypothetical protein
VATHEEEGIGVAMVRTHAMELGVRHGARMRGSTRAGPTTRASGAMGGGVPLQYICARDERVSWCECMKTAARLSMRRGVARKYIYMHGRG